MSDKQAPADLVVSLARMEAGLKVIGDTLHDLTDRLHQQDRRIAELMARTAGLEALARAHPDLTRRVLVLEGLVGIRLGTMATRPAGDSDPVKITDHAPNAPR